MSSSDFKSFLPDGKTKFAFLLGNPVAHSLSPALHTRWFRKTGFNAVYLASTLTSEKNFLEFATLLIEQENFLGANITIPFKRVVLRLPGIQVPKRILEIGAANTLYRESATGQWTLANTDCAGVHATLKRFSKDLGSFECLVLGAGGAAAAALATVGEFSSCRSKAVFARNPQKANSEMASTLLGPGEEILPLTDNGFHSWIQTHPNENSIVVINALPLGSGGEDNSYVDTLLTLLSGIGRRVVFFEMIYKDTPAVMRARALGVEAVNGSIMLETQAKESFKLWTGLTPE